MSSERNLSVGKSLHLNITAMLTCKCLQISHFGIMEMQGLIILSSRQ